MIAAFDSMMGSTISDASQASSDDFETSERTPFGDECHAQSSRDLVGYSKGAPDPKHHGQAMRSAMKAKWIKSQTSKMDGPWRRGVFQNVLRSSLTPQDHVFTSWFHYKINRNGWQFDKCKVRLVVQGQHMRRKGEDGVGDYDDTFSPMPAASGFCTIFSLATQQKWSESLTTSTFLRLSFRENYRPETAIPTEAYYAEEILRTCIEFLECHSSPYSSAAQHAPQQRRW
jgi:hypothetical protein